MSRFHNTLLDLSFSAENESERRAAFKTLISEEFDGDLVFEHNGHKYNVILGAIERRKRRAPRAAQPAKRKYTKRAAAKRRVAAPSKDDILSKIKNYLGDYIGTIDKRTALAKLAEDGMKEIHAFEKQIQEKKSAGLTSREKILSKAYALTLAVRADDRKAVDFATHLLYDGHTRGMRIASNQTLPTLLATAMGKLVGMEINPQQVKSAVEHLVEMNVAPSKVDPLFRKSRMTLYALSRMKAA